MIGYCVRRLSLLIWFGMCFWSLLLCFDCLCFYALESGCSVDTMSDHLSDVFGGSFNGWVSWIYNEM